MSTLTSCCTPITFASLEAFTRGTVLPASAVNDSGENVILTTEPFEDSYCYRLDTYQKNGWIRINRYYPTGDTDETYTK